LTYYLSKPSTATATGSLWCRAWVIGWLGKAECTCTARVMATNANTIEACFYIDSNAVEDFLAHSTDFDEVAL